MSPRTFRAVRILAGLATAGAVLLSPATALPVVASAPTVNSVGLCGSPLAGHRACMVRVATANGRRLAANRPAVLNGFTAPPTSAAPMV